MLLKKDILMVSKNVFDKFFSILGIVLLWPVFVLIVLIIKLSSSGPAIFKQKRVGQKNKMFTIYKFRTMIVNDSTNTVSVKGDDRITRIGKFLRKYKLDELPELWNILKGDMSFVGPRPDVPGYMDMLEGEDRIILKLKPGLTGPASLKYIDEEEILSNVDNPIEYNDKVIFPDKVRINKLYLENWAILLDLKIIMHTLLRVKYCESNYFENN